MSRTRTYYKVLTKDGKAPQQNDQWSLPRKPRFGGQFQPGMWHTVTGKIRPCLNGLHVVATPKSIRNYLTPDNRLFICQVRGQIVRNGRGAYMKYACRTVRLVSEVLRGSPGWKRALRGTQAAEWTS